MVQLADADLSLPFAVTDEGETASFSNVLLCALFMPENAFKKLGVSSDRGHENTRIVVI